MDFKKASLPKLRSAAKDLGVELRDDMNREEILAQFAKELGAEKSPTARPKFELPRRDERDLVAVLIPQDKNPALNHPVPMCVNGYECKIPRGQRVEVPRFIADALANAVETHYVYGDKFNADDELEHTVIHTPRFSQQIAA